MNAEREITKSLFLAGLQCRKKIWLLTNEPEKALPQSGFQQRLMDQGLAVGVLARDRFENGLTIETPSYNPDRVLDQTRRALDRGANVLFEAGFRFDGVFVRVDVLSYSPGKDSFDIIEVKSSSGVKPEHIPDLAVQKYVVRGAGVAVGSCVLMHINTRCVWPDTSSFFSVDDVSEEVSEFERGLSDTVRDFKTTASEPAAPDVPIGPHCLHPYECGFKSFCWRGVPDFSIFDLKRLSAAAKSELQQCGHLAVSSIPPDFPLSPADRELVSVHATGEPEIHWPEISAELTELEYPLFFLDFETDNPAIPLFDGIHPYEQVPFQYSLHVLSKQPPADHAEEDFAEDSEYLREALQQREYLHMENTDPRLNLAESLLNDIGPCGTIIAYYAAFEKGVIGRLAESLPQYAGRLRQLLPRFWDPLPVLRAHYRHPGFRGSYSLKSVLPVVVPEMSYDDLAVRDGNEAQTAWTELISSADKTRRAEIAEALKSYCGQDTAALVKLYIHFLRNSIQGGSYAGSGNT